MKRSSMYLTKLSLVTGAATLLLWFSAGHASLDLLAGVEAGIETDTAMTTTDLDHTQRVLSTQTIGSRHFWLNETTGTAYEIIITHQFAYGRHPCLAYNLVIKQEDNIETKSLNACRNDNGKWISVTATSTAL